MKQLILLALLFAACSPATVVQETPLTLPDGSKLERYVVKLENGKWHYVYVVRGYNSVTTNWYNPSARKHETTVTLEKP